MPPGFRLTPETRRFGKEMTMRHTIRNAVIVAGLAAMLALPASASAERRMNRCCPGAGWLGVALGIVSQVVVDRCSIERWNHKIRIHCE